MVYFEIYPFAELTTRGDSLSSRAPYTSFTQKIIDAVDSFAGTCMFRLRKPEAGESLPIYIETLRFNPNSIRIGLADILIIPKLLSLASYFLFNLADSIPGPDFITLPLKFAAFGVLCFFSAIQFTISAVLTLISLPVIGIVHLCTNNDKEKKAFTENYEKQYEKDEQVTMAITVTSKKPNPTIYKHAAHQLLATCFSEKLGDSSFGVITDDKTIKSHHSKKLILIQYDSLNAAGNAASKKDFIAFKYNRAGRAAFIAFRQLNFFGFDHTFKKTEMDIKVSNMFFTFFLLAPMSRNPEQRLLKATGIQRHSSHRPTGQVCLVKHDRPHHYTFFESELTKNTFIIPIEMVKEIAARTMDDKDGLSLEERMAMVTELETTFRRK